MKHTPQWTDFSRNEQIALLALNAMYPNGIATAEYNYREISYYAMDNNSNLYTYLVNGNLSGDITDLGRFIISSNTLTISGAEMTSYTETLASFMSFYDKYQFIVDDVSEYVILILISCIYSILIKSNIIKICKTRIINPVTTLMIIIKKAHQALFLT